MINIFVSCGTTKIDFGMQFCYSIDDKIKLSKTFGDFRNILANNIYFKKNFRLEKIVNYAFRKI